MNLPNNFKNRTKIDPKLAVGSSLPKPKELIALIILLYILNDEKEYIEYSVQDGTKIQIKQELIDLIKSYFSNVTNYSSEKIDRLRTENSLVSMQLEPLQVSLQIVFKLAKIKILNSESSSQERTKGIRSAKSLNFTSNMILLKFILSDDNNQVTDSVKNVLYRWIFNEDVDLNYKDIEDKLKSTLLIFAEDTLYKTWLNTDTSILFQLEGVYDILNNETDIVNLKGAKEIKGTLRNLKSLIAHGMHPYLKIEGDVVSLREKSIVEPFYDYRNKVSNYLDLTPKPIETAEINVEDEQLTNKKALNVESHQIIFYGSPGTGKSRQVEIITRGYNRVRTTFHPETDYHSFVGSYKPVMNDNNIKYDFVPQSFTKAYCNAWLNPAQPYFLIIEEINRGNCAQIFGDLFQCLDRNDDGYSKYEIICDKDLANYLKSVFDNTENIEAASRYKDKVNTVDFDKIILPSNLYILATMNTSDQSLFPMDSAFKRRWDWQFIPINYNDAHSLNILVGDNVYNWGRFIEIINGRIKELTGSEDKQIGNRFINPKDKNISFEHFRSKVLFYLWSEVYKDEYGTQSSIFKYELNDGGPIDFQFGELFKENALDVVRGFLKFNGIEPE